MSFPHITLSTPHKRPCKAGVSPSLERQTWTRVSQRWRKDLRAASVIPEAVSSPHVRAASLYTTLPTHGHGLWQCHSLQQQRGWGKVHLTHAGKTQEIKFLRTEALSISPSESSDRQKDKDKAEEQIFSWRKRTERQPSHPGTGQEWRKRITIMEALVEMAVKLISRVQCQGRQALGRQWPFTSWQSSFLLGRSQYRDTKSDYFENDIHTWRTVLNYFKIINQKQEWLKTWSLFELPSKAP